MCACACACACARFENFGVCFLVDVVRAVYVRCVCVLVAHIVHSGVLCARAHVRVLACARVCVCACVCVA